MHKYFSVLILVEMLAGWSFSVTAQAPLTTPENSTTSSGQAESLRDLINSANSKINKGEYQAARLDLNKAIELSPQNAPLFALRGIVYTGLERHERAIQDYNQAIQIDQKNIIFYNLRGEAYIKTQQYQFAVINYSQILQLNPNSSQAYTKRAFVYQALNDGDKAISDFNQAVVLSPQDPEVYNSRGKFYASIFSASRSPKGRPLPFLYTPIDDIKNKAFKDYDMAIKLNPKVAIYYYNRGDLHIEIMKSYTDVLFRSFDRGSEKDFAINDLKIAAKLFLESDDQKNYKIVMQTISDLR
jgi:tetratricopeptide (TPR) repeat protein